MINGRNWIWLMVVMLGMSTVLTGCGRKGKLEAPPSAAEIVETDEQGRPIKRKQDEEIEDNPFILDPLI